MPNINDYTDIDNNIKSLKKIIGNNKGLIQEVPYNPVVSKELNTSNFMNYFDDVYGGDSVDLFGYDNPMYDSNFDDPRIPLDTELENDDLTKAKDNTDYSNFDNGETLLLTN